MFREVALPKKVEGRLLLHSMPGRCESLEATWTAARAAGVKAIVRLAGIEEVQQKSPSYAKLLADSAVPFDILACEIPDFGVPSDRGTFKEIVLVAADRLRNGQAILVHCGAGVGRTGTFAVCVLLALGESRDLAIGAVCSAGSGAETPAQRELINWWTRCIGGRER